MTGKEFKEYINKTLEDDDIIDYIVIGSSKDSELIDLDFDRINSEEKNYFSLHD